MCDYCYRQRETEKVTIGKITRDICAECKRKYLTPAPMPGRPTRGAAR